MQAEVAYHTVRFAAQVSAPSSSGLTQPQATIWAAGIAVGAATIALIGVLINAAVSQRQHRDKDSAAIRDRNRTEAIDALLEALSATMDLWILVGIMHNKIMGKAMSTADPTDSELDTARAKIINAKLKLELLGLGGSDNVDEVRKSLNRLALEFKAGNKSSGFAEAMRTRDKMIASFQATLAQIDAATPRKRRT
ncbi:hypothetical protein ACFTS5_12910 [Nocardia sp. NPDC056952]|uniref:hypothetical protein n=1 Tax=Nocardia sp. NPDC056952 TaxID=3345979 RepID=UPI003632F3A8